MLSDIFVNNSDIFVNNVNIGSDNEKKKKKKIMACYLPGTTSWLLTDWWLNPQE